MRSKICIVSTKAYPLFNPKCNETYGGSEVQMFMLAKELSKEFDVSVIVGDFGQKEIEEYDGVKVVKSFSLEKKILNYVKGPIKLYKALKRVNPDVVVQRSAAAETGIIGKKV